MTKTTADRLTTLEAEVVHLRASGDERRDIMTAAMDTLEKKLDAITKAVSDLSLKVVSIDTKVSEKTATDDRFERFVKVFTNWRFWAAFTIIVALAGGGLTLGLLIGLDTADRLARLQTLVK